MNRRQWITLIGALGLIAAAFLPWISVEALFGNIPGVDRGIEIGWEGDGYLTAGIGIILILLALTSMRNPGGKFYLPGILLGLLACLLITADFVKIVQMAPEGSILASTGIGLYLTLGAGFLVIIGGLVSPNTVNINPVQPA